MLTVATVLPTVLLMAAVHACARADGRVYGMLAFGWMLLVAVLTTTVHVVELTVGRRLDPASVAGSAQLFAFTWPSVSYAVDIVA